MTAAVIPFPPNQYARPFLRHAGTRSTPVHEAAGWMAIPPRPGERRATRTVGSETN